MKDLPGYGDATALGYTLTSSAGNGKTANYFKDKKTLIVDDRGHATLWANIGIVELEIKSFAFPNKNFQMFEGNLDAILLAYVEFLERLEGIF